VTSARNPYSLHTAQVSVSYVPDVWGKTRRETEALRAAAENQAFQREAVYLTLVSNIALAAIQEGSLRAQISATRRIISAQAQLLGVLRRQLELGQVAQPDVLAQETTVAQAKLVLPRLDKELEQQRHLLAVLTGRFPTEGASASFDLKSFSMLRRIAQRYAVVIRLSNLWNIIRNCLSYSAFAPENLTTLAHFSVSAASISPKSVEDPGSIVAPMAANRAFMFASPRAALISALSLSMISAGVFLGAPMPFTALAS
jgi:Outer membrane efflux protein